MPKGRVVMRLREITWEAHWPQVPGDGVESEVELAMEQSSGMTGSEELNPLVENEQVVPLW